MRDQLLDYGIPARALDASTVHRLEPADGCAIGGWVVRRAGAAPLACTGVIALDRPGAMSWLDPGLLDWESGEPALVAGLLAPGLAHLYFLGAGTAVFRAGGLALLTAMIRAQETLEHPLVDELMTVLHPSHRGVSGRAARRVERRLERRLQAAENGSWRAAAGDIDGPLAAARGA